MSGGTSFQSLPGTRKSGRSPQIPPPPHPPPHPHPSTNSWVFCLPATRTLISLKLKDITQRSCQYPHFVTKPYRFTPDELLCTAFVKTGDHCFVDTQVLLIHESKVYKQNLPFFMLRRGRTFAILSPTPSPALSFKWMHFIISSNRFLVKAEAMVSL